MEDDRVAILEAQLAQAKLIAEEADKKYEEVRPDHRISYSNCTKPKYFLLSLCLMVMVVIRVLFH